MRLLEKIRQKGEHELLVYEQILSRQYAKTQKAKTQH